MGLQRVLLVYDITEDKPRTKIATACQDYGLDRMQFSAFIGQLTRNQQEELMLKIKRLMGKSAGNIKLIPISEQDWKRRLEVDYA